MNLSIVDLNNLNEFVEVSTERHTEYYDGAFGGSDTCVTNNTDESQEFYIDDSLAVRLLGDEDITEMHEAYFDDIKEIIEGLTPKLINDNNEEFDVCVNILRRSDYKTYLNVSVK